MGTFVLFWILNTGMDIASQPSENNPSIVQVLEEVERGNRPQYKVIHIEPTKKKKKIEGNGEKKDPSGQH